MNKLWLIIKREYLIRVRKKTFILATLLTPLAFGLLIFGSSFLAHTMAEGEKNLLVKDDSGIFENGYADDSNITFDFSHEELTELKSTYKQNGYDFLVYIPAFTDSTAREHNIQFFSQEKLGLTTIERVEGIVAASFRSYKIAQSGIQKEVYEGFDVNINLENGALQDQAIESEGDKSGKLSIVIGTVLGGVMGFLMYMVIFIFGNMVMRSVMEEKINRIVEVMISSVRPFQLMLGKVIGVGGVGITQLLIWIILIPLITLVVGFFTGGNPMEAQQMTEAMGQGPVQEAQGFDMAMVLTEFRSLNWWLILPSFIIFFLGGYLIYSSLFAAIGSAIGDDLGESQSLMWPIILPVIFALMIMMSSLENPNSNMAVFGSIFPLFSPIVMPARLAFDPPLWQVFLSLGLLILTSLFFVWLSGRIYRIGILMYGKRLTFREIGKWLFHS